MLKRLFDFLSRGYDLWVAVQLAFPAAAGAMTAGWAAIAGEPWHLILFYGFGVLAFSSVFVWYALRAIREHTAFERLRVARTEPVLLHPNREAGVVSILLKHVVQNASDTQNLYIRLKRADVRLQGKANDVNVRDSEVTVIPPRGEQAIQASFVPDLNVKEIISGTTELEVLYGRDPKSLRYMMRYETDPALSIVLLNDEKAQMSFVAPIRKYEHLVI